MQRIDSIVSKLSELGFELPEAPSVKGNYLPFVVTGNIVHLSGTLPIKDGKIAYLGQVGDSQSIEDGYHAAQLCIINALSNLRVATDDFAKFDRIVSLAGFVNGVNGFADAPKVINGASDLLVNILGDDGRHARVAVSTNGLPLNASVEIQVIASLKD